MVGCDPLKQARQLLRQIQAISFEILNAIVQCNCLLLMYLLGFLECVKKKPTAALMWVMMSDCIWM